VVRARRVREVYEDRPFVWGRGKEVTYFGKGRRKAFDYRQDRAYIQGISASCMSWMQRAYAFTGNSQQW
jgi:hypothetical protein